MRRGTAHPRVQYDSAAPVALHGVTLRSSASLCGRWIVVVEVCYGLVEGNPSFHSHALVEGKVGLVGYAVWGCGVYDGLVEGEDGVFFVEEVGWYLLDVCVEADAEECLLLEDLG